MFDDFWKAYPRKDGKEAARKAFAKAVKTRADLETVLNALEWQRSCDQWAKDGGQFIPHASTYLNNRRFNDEPIRPALNRQESVEARNRAAVEAALAEGAHA